MIIKIDPLTTTGEFAEELNVDHSVVIWHLKQIRKVKKLNKWVSHKLTKNLKRLQFEVSSLFLCNKSEPFLNHMVMCEEKWILYDNW